MANHISSGFRHLLTLVEEEPMNRDLLRDRQLCRHQKRRPIDGMEAPNIFANYMGGSWPIMCTWIAGIRKASGRDIIGECVNPNIHHMLGMAWHRNAPIKCGAADREIFQPAFDER